MSLVKQRSCVVFVTDKTHHHKETEGRSPDRTNAQRKQQGYAPSWYIFRTFSATKTTEQCSFFNLKTSSFLNLSFKQRSCVFFVTDKMHRHKETEGRSPDTLFYPIK